MLWLGHQLFDEWLLTDVTEITVGALVVTVLVGVSALLIGMPVAATVRDIIRTVRRHREGCQYLAEKTHRVGPQRCDPAVEARR